METYNTIILIFIIVLIVWYFSREKTKAGSDTLANPIGADLVEICGRDSMYGVNSRCPHWGMPGGATLFEINRRAQMYK